MNAGDAQHAAQAPQFQAVLDCVSDGVFTIARNYTVTSFNRAAERLTGLRRRNVLGRFCFDVFGASACKRAGECPMGIALRTGGGHTTRELTLRNGCDRPIHVRLAFHPLRDDAGEIVGGVETIHELPARETVAATCDESGTPLSLLEANERRVIEETLRRHDWNRSAAARELGISRITLWRKMNKLGIAPGPEEQ